MKTQRMRFIVLALVDRNDYGYDENTLPQLVALVDAASPDGWQWLHTGPIGYFHTSALSVESVHRIIEQAEKLRRSDERFSSLGIGLAEGEMIGAFTDAGSLDLHAIPVGTVMNDALLSAQTADGYRETMQWLLHHFKPSA